MHRRLIGFAAVLVFTMGIMVPATYSATTQVDSLIEKLVEKKILTREEARSIKAEIVADEKVIREDGLKQSLPSWVQNVKLKGDLRIRYQWDHTFNDRNDTNRGRLRFRLGLDAKVNEKLNIGIGLATGKNDGSANQDKDFARSTNQSLENGFTKHAIGLDYVYAQYQATPEISGIMGKFKNPLWEPGDLIWDTDINPEGGALQLTKKINPKLDLFLTPGVFILDEVSSSAPSSSSQDDPTLFVNQAGLNYNLTDNVSVKGAVSYYVTSNTKNASLPGTVSTNTRLSNYDLITPAAEIKFKKPFKFFENIGILDKLVAVRDIPHVSFFGEYANNPQAKTKNTGYMVGIKFGADKIAAWGDWQLAYNYAMLSKDAVLDILPDSDRVSGKTGIRAHEAIWQFGLGKNTFLSLDYYQGWSIAGNPVPQHVVQVDWNLKF